MRIREKRTLLVGLAVMTVMGVGGPSARSNDGHIFSWDGSKYCDSRGFDAWCSSGAESSLTEEFETWVSLLEPGDEKSLTAFGLNLDELRSLPGRGVHGFVVSGWPTDLLPLDDDPHVMSLRVADIAVRG
ncbi:hypothetical protein [Microbispora sp. NPDC049633]|uniref:hypothetical protein n=1 Tax=Microbispora sp. NPDC049633 TaxID=3154355 RepID=UPI003416DCB6